ncbi:NUDIX domain-containing protein [Veronia pacifica]|uniref:Nudix hydrolase domain-containing protein n=1 Tax=Veronia pacifica TaxID=1080227 RepID=A0A1C3ESQ8_9GAMM|nr:NUDIX domain-containing protein [Veronia pacifica]ODA36276.1 hypothetical protein A8L45_01365 [Veronia pacifica]
MKPRVSVVFISDNKRILLIKRSKGNREYWVFPGGGVEPDESLDEAVRRETFEETSFVIEEATPIFSINNNVRHEHFYTARTVEFTPQLSPCGPEFTAQNRLNSYDLKWIDISEMTSLDVFPSEAKELVDALIAEARI